MEVVLAIVFVLLVAAGVVFLIRFMIRAQKAAFAAGGLPLLPVIAGTAQKQTLRGTYAGNVVTVKSVGDGSDSNDRVLYAMRVDLATEPGLHDWTLRFTGDGLLGLGKQSWHVVAHDKELAARLTEGGACEIVAGWAWGVPTIVYHAKTGTFEARTPTGTTQTWPSPDAFRTQLDVLVALAALNRRVNSAGVEAARG